MNFSKTGFHLNEKMTKTVLSKAFLFLFLLAIPAFSFAGQGIILLIGDGFGLEALSVTRQYEVYGGSGQELEIVKLINDGTTGFITTHPTDVLVTDSAAAGTALATGNKTENGIISMLPDKTEVSTVLEEARRAGMKVGLVTTTRVTHATPACFAAHEPSRGMENEIAVDMLEHDLDVLLGGGLRYWLPSGEGAGGRKDGRNLVNEARENGAYFVQTAREMYDAPKGKLLGLFNASHMSYEIDRHRTAEPSIAEMVRTAIKHLSEDDSDFFLMVEGGRIDHAAHANDAPGLIHDTLAFDDAVREARNFVETDPDSLMLVTGDHVTGAPAFVYMKDPTGKTTFVSKEQLDNLKAATASFEFIEKKINKYSSISEITRVFSEHRGIELDINEVEVYTKGKFPAPAYNSGSNLMGAMLAPYYGINWNSGNHTGAALLLIGYGRGAEACQGWKDNTDVARLIRASINRSFAHR